MSKRKAKYDPSKVDRVELENVMKQRKRADVPISDIMPNDYNKNKMGEMYFAALKANLANPKIGFTIPVLLRPNPDKDSPVKYVIIDGEHRYRAAKDIGYTEVPAVIFPDIPLALAKYLTVESNAIHGDTADSDIKNMLLEIEQDPFFEDTDIWANTVTEEPAEDTSKYALDDEDLEDLGTEATTPVTLYLKRPEQIDRFRIVTGQMRMSHGYTLEEAVMDCIEMMAESTGMGMPTGDENVDKLDKQRTAQRIAKDLEQ